MMRKYDRETSILAMIISVLVTSTAMAATSFPEYRHSIDFCPMSPLFKIYAVHYCYHVTKNNEFIAGPLYMNIQYEMGHTNAPGFIVGYRRYFWKNLHMDYQLMPGWDNFYEKNEDRRYPGFDLWNEFRAGYSFDFKIGKVPLFVNVQWPFGFALYSKGKPESFMELARKKPYFWFPPMFFTGIRL